MKRLLMVSALCCALSGSALAGEVPTVGAPAPPPNGITQTPPSPGDIPSVGVAEQLTSDALSALLSVLGLLAV